jgi:hypothetical protein
MWPGENIQQSSDLTGHKDRNRMVTGLSMFKIFPQVAIDAIQYAQTLQLHEFMHPKPVLGKYRIKKLVANEKITFRCDKWRQSFD